MDIGAKTGTNHNKRSLWFVPIFASQEDNTNFAYQFLWQDADSFKDKMGGFRKSIKNIADLVFISAPLLIPEEQAPDAMYGKNILKESGDCLKAGRSWWFNYETHFHSRTKSENAIGFKETLDAVKDAFKSLGPFDGIFGFSQGACLASLICGLKEHNEFPFNFSFVILVSGFPSLVESHQYLYNKIVTTKSLHIIGKDDTCIPKELGDALTSKFESPMTVYHDGGHFVPTQSEVRMEYKVFLEKMLETISRESAPSNVL